MFVSIICCQTKFLEMVIKIVRVLTNKLLQTDISVIESVGGVMP